MGCTDHPHADLARYVAGEGWQEPTPLEHEDGRLIFADVAIDAGGAATIVWTQDSGIGTDAQVWAKRFD